MCYNHGNCYCIIANMHWEVAMKIWKLRKFSCGISDLRGNCYHSLNCHHRNPECSQPPHRGIHPLNLRCDHTQIHTNYYRDVVIIVWITHLGWLLSWSSLFLVSPQHAGIFLWLPSSLSWPELVPELLFYTIAIYNVPPPYHVFVKRKKVGEGRETNCLF